MPTAPSSAGWRPKWPRVLRGKHKPIFAPHLDTGDHVIVVNAAKVVMTAGKADKKFHYRHSGYPGGLTPRPTATCWPSGPKSGPPGGQGMLPKGPLGRQMLRKLKVYAGPEHPHAAQTPQAPALDHSRPSAPDPAPQRRTPAVPKPLTQTTGRRKAAVARVRLRPGPGPITVNGRPVEDYFPSATHRMVLTEPLRLVEKAEDYDVDADPRRRRHVRPGRRPAPRHRPGPGRARRRPAGPAEAGRFPHPDPREKEQKKYGLKKARKAPQYSKR